MLIHRRPRFALALAGSLCLAAFTASAGDRDRSEREGRERHSKAQVCSATAGLQYQACKHEVEDDFFTASAICLNTSDREERGDCLEEAETEQSDGRALCREQKSARRELCDALGEGRYDPEFAPDLFDSDFANLTNPNPYVPLEIGSRWVYAGGDEVVTIEVLPKTKDIEGVTCIVVNDVVEREGNPVEDTDDWIAQRLDGDTDYCGESVRDYETFPGDSPPEPELVEIAGSFKVGRDGAKAGTFFPASPQVGQLFRQEWHAGNAEDAVLVLSNDYSFGEDPELDEHVPQDLAELLCDGDCVVTRDFSPIEPGVFQHKFYAPGIGRFLEVSPESGDISQLIECSLNLDPRCAALPRP